MPGATRSSKSGPSSRGQNDPRPSVGVGATGVASCAKEVAGKESREQQVEVSVSFGA